MLNAAIYARKSTDQSDIHEAETWLREHTDGTWFGGALVVEHRYVEDLLEGARDAGFALGRDA